MCSLPVREVDTFHNTKKMSTDASDVITVAHDWKHGEPNVIGCFFIGDYSNTAVFTTLFHAVKRVLSSDLTYVDTGAPYEFTEQEFARFLATPPAPAGYIIGCVGDAYLFPQSITLTRLSPKTPHLSH